MLRKAVIVLAAALAVATVFAPTGAAAYWGGWGWRGFGWGYYPYSYRPYYRWGYIPYARPYSYPYYRRYYVYPYRAGCWRWGC
jgi:hypothetical protein